MPALERAVVSGSLAAIRIVRQFLSLPAIIYRPVTDTGFPLPSQIVFLQTTSYRELLPSQVSKMLLVDVSRGKSFINDNIAPLPRAWAIEGFLFPAVPIIPATDQIQLEGLKETLRQASRSRQQVEFRPVATSITAQFSQVFDAIANQKITGTVSVAMENLEFDTDPTIGNKAPFRMTLLEMDSLSAQIITGQTLSSASPDGALTNPAASPLSNPQGNTANIQTPAALP